MDMHYTGASGVQYAADYMFAGGEVYPVSYHRDAESGAVILRLSVETGNGARPATITYHADHGDYTAACAAERLSCADDGQSVDDLLVGMLADIGADRRVAEPEPVAAAEPEKPLPAWAGESIQGNGFCIRFDAFYRRTCIAFDDMPCKQARELCKANGFFWSPNRGLWVRGLNQKGRRASEALAPQLAALTLYDRKPAARRRRAH